VRRDVTGTSKTTLLNIPERQLSASKLAKRVSIY
jgi:hypothetical protein